MKVYLVWMKEYPDEDTDLNQEVIGVYANREESREVCDYEQERGWGRKYWTEEREVIGAP